MASLTAAGLSLSSKSDAAVVAVGGSGQSAPDALNFSGFASSGEFSLSVAAGFGASENLQFFQSARSGTISVYTLNSSCGGFGIFDLAGESLFAEGSVPGVDLSDTGNSWTGFANTKYTIGDRFVVGWRFTSGPTEGYHYGWTTVEMGSVIHGESMANDVQGEAIILGTNTVPEPGSLALLALGGAGLLAQRKRRRAAA